MTIGTGDTLRVYGPGGPYLPVSECARDFTADTGLAVEVVKGPPEELAARIAADGDVHYTGAPYMMREFMDAHPGVIDPASVVSLGLRRVGILTRPGNPKNVLGPADLSRPDIQVLDVALENMGELRGDGAKPANIARFVTTGEQGLAAWLADPGLDAWVTYRSWLVAAPEASAFVAVEGPEWFRETPAAVALGSRIAREAVAFIDFMRGPRGAGIFRKYGWE